MENKRIKNRIQIMIMTLLFCIMLFGSTVVHAEGEEKDVYHVDQDGSSFFISIVWESGDIQVHLVDPDENPIGLDAGNITCETDEGEMLILVENAKEGWWKLVFDSGYSDSVEIAAYSNEAPMYVGSVAVGTPDAENNVPVSFETSQDPGRSFNYELRLGLTPDMTETRVIATGSGNANETVSTQVSFNDVNTYPEYYMEVVVTYDKDGMKYMYTAVSDAFAYTNPTPAPIGIEDFNLQVNTLGEEMTVDIQGYVNDVATIIVTLYEDGTAGEQQVFDREKVKDKAVVTYNPEAQVIDCAVSTMNNAGRISDPIIKTVYLAPQPDVFTMSVPDSGTLSENILHLEYQNAKNQTVTVRKTLTGYPEDIVLNGSGDRRITLDEMPAEIEVKYTTADNVTYIYDRILSLDDVAPELKIYESLNNMVTDKDSVVMTGKTEPDAILTVNDEAVELNADGSFMKELSLDSGDNKFVVRATDEAGNESAYAINIICSKDGTRPTADEDEILEEEGEMKQTFVDTIAKWLWLILISFAALLILCEFLFAILGRTKRPKTKTTMRAAIILLIFSTLGLTADLTYYILRRHFEKSADYLDLAVNHIKKAYKYLQVTKLCRILLITFAALTLISVIVILITKRKMPLDTYNQPQPKQPKPKKPKKVKAQPVVPPAPSYVQPEQQPYVQPEQQVQPQQQYVQPEQQTQQTQQPTQETVEMKYCKYCGAQIKATAKFCKICGQQL